MKASLDWTRALSMLREVLAPRLLQEAQPRASPNSEASVRELCSDIGASLGRAEMQVADFFAAVEGSLQARSEQRSALQSAAETVAQATEAMQRVQSLALRRRRALAERVAALRGLCDECARDLEKVKVRASEQPPKAPPLYLCPITDDLCITVVNRKWGCFRGAKLRIVDSQNETSEFACEIAPGIQTIDLNSFQKGSSKFWVVVAVEGTEISNRREWAEVQLSETEAQQLADLQAFFGECAATDAFKKHFTRLVRTGESTDLHQLGDRLSQLLYA